MENILEKAIQLQNHRTKFALCTIVQAKGSTPRKEGAKLIVTDQKQTFGSIGGGNLEYFVIEKAIELIKYNKKQLLTFNLKQDLNMACGGQVSIFIETIMPKNQLILFGAGHISQALAPIALSLDFQVIVVDPRKHVLNSWILKENIIFVNDDFENAFNRLKIDEQTFICSLAFTHELDLKVAQLALKHNYAYLGVIASKNKARKIANALAQDFNLPLEKINSIDMPMGIPIACQTPQEIAISIAAKIIDVKNKLNEDKSIKSDKTQISVQTFKHSPSS